MLPRPLVVWLTILISVVWAGNVIAGYLDPAHHDATINAIFAIVVGSIFGLGQLGGKKKEAVRAVREARKKIAKALEQDDADDDPPEGQPRGDDR
jgi:hypothetical protein